MHRGEGWVVYLRAIVVVKAARGMAIRFPDSATVWPLEADQLHSVLPQLRSALHRFFTRTERWFVSEIKFYLSLFQLVLLCHFYSWAIALLFKFCLKLKSGPFKCIFPTVTVGSIFKMVPSMCYPIRLICRWRIFSPTSLDWLIDLWNNIHLF